MVSERARTVAQAGGSDEGQGVDPIPPVSQSQDWFASKLRVVGLDVHKARWRSRAIALLSLGDWVPRSRSFGVAVLLLSRRHGHAKP